MIIVLTGILIAQAITPPRAADPPPEIVVVGEKMRRIRLFTRVDKKSGIRGCVIQQSSGDAHIDEAMCEAAVACGSVETEPAGMQNCMGTRMAAIAQRFAASPPKDAPDPLAAATPQP